MPKEHSSPSKDSSDELMIDTSALAVIAHPLANGKLTKKIFKAVKKGK